VRLGVKWITNAPAPYRLPVWEHLGRAVDLEVLLLRTRRQYAADPGNRGRDWADVTPHGYTIRELPTSYVTRGDTRHFVTRPFALRFGSDTSAVVLGGWDSPSYLQALVTAKRAGKATIGFYESTLDSQSHAAGPVSALRRFFFRHLDAVVVPGKAAEDAIMAMNLDRPRVFRGFNAVDVRAIHTSASAARADLLAAAIPQPGHRYLYLGQLVPRKNVRTAIEAFAAAAAPGDSLTIAGTGELEEELRALATPGVSFVGPVAYTDLPALLARHDTLVLPSNLEVWGLVVNEALAAGLHAVVSNRCGVAASVSGMTGVTIVDPTADGLRDGLVESRRTWQGAITSPEILSCGPEQFAGVFFDAIDYAAARTAPARS
jgi:glycosyltransferase involved in cell wall biosynthesis